MSYAFGWPYDISLHQQQLLDYNYGIAASMFIILVSVLAINVTGSVGLVALHYQ